MLLKWAITHRLAADATILREHDPAALANFNTPIFVFGIRDKVVVVSLLPAKNYRDYL